MPSVLHLDSQIECTCGLQFLQLSEILFKEGVRLQFSAAPRVLLSSYFLYLGHTLLPSSVST